MSEVDPKVSAVEDVGPHLLGRVPAPPDDRDWKMSTAPETDPLDAALNALLASRSVAAATKQWAKLIQARVVGGVTPPPPPAPVTGDVIWADVIQLDQGQTPHCVGFGCAGWCDSAPVEDKLQNADGHAIYYECKVLDGEPKVEDGTSVHSGAKALSNRGRMQAGYYWAQTIGDVTTWLDTKGPVIFGTDWYDAMFSPDASGYVKPTGSIAGGHCFLALGHLKGEDAILFQNSWGPNWGLKGRFKMKLADAAMLLAAQGEACAGIENA